MKFSFILSGAALLLALLPMPSMATVFDEPRTEADQLYAEQDYRKAYRIYHKLAKQGDHYSQDRIATMYARGEGKKVNLIEAYSWSRLAAEGGNEEFKVKSEELLADVNDPAKAEKRADKLMKKYGQEALEEKAQRQENRRRTREMGGCTGSKMGCSR